MYVCALRRRPRSEPGGQALLHWRLQPKSGIKFSGLLKPRRSKDTALDHGG
jgi:hypothetical protein